jgi:hypothetical protein
MMHPVHAVHRQITSSCARRPSYNHWVVLKLPICCHGTVAVQQYFGTRSKAQPLHTVAKASCTTYNHSKHTELLYTPVADTAQVRPNNTSHHIVAARTTCRCQCCCRCCHGRLLLLLLLRNQVPKLQPLTAAVHGPHTAPHSAAARHNIRLTLAN